MKKRLTKRPMAERHTQKHKTIKVGDPLDETVDIGLLATVSIVSEIAAQVEKTVAMGGKILVKGCNKITGRQRNCAPFSTE